jgi:hypothetical protein
MLRPTNLEERLGSGEEMWLAVDYGSLNSHVRALAVNVTAVDGTGAGYLTTWDGFSQMPYASTLNFTKGAVVPNFAIIPTAPCSGCGSASGYPSIGIYASMDTHVVVDIIGFYGDGQLADGTKDGYRFTPQTPKRIVDSRIGLGMPGALGQQGTATVAAPGLPAATAALALNVTAVAPTNTTFISVWPYGLNRPNVSTLNPSAGQIIPQNRQAQTELCGAPAGAA